MKIKLLLVLIFSIVCLTCHAQNDKEADTLTNFEKAGLEALVLLQNWEAGKHDDKNVNVILTMTINVDYNNR